MSPPTHISAQDLSWSTAAAYPEALQRVVRWKTLVGEEPGVPLADVRMGLLTLDPGGYYPAHAHPAPEIYLVLSGAAEWTVGEETFCAEAGTAIYHAPNIPHRMVNNGQAPLQAVWWWWAPEGRREVLSIGVTLLEPMPVATDGPTGG
jgi:quercetin dioxygenase-like cupin family protein